MVSRKLLYIVGIELLTMARAFDLMPKEEREFSSVTSSVHDKVREVVPYVDGDRHFGPDIEAATGLVREGKILETVEMITGTLEF